jgi:hypothetical protein
VQVISDPTTGMTDDLTADSLVLEANPATPLTVVQLLKAILLATDGIDPLLHQTGINGQNLEAAIAEIRDLLPTELINNRLPVDILSAPSAPVSTLSSWRSAIKLPNSVDGSTGKRAWLVPSNREWQLMGLGARLQTSSTVGNRQAELVINPGTNSLLEFHFRAPAGCLQPTSLTYDYHFGMGLPYLTTAQANTVLCPISPAILAAQTTVILWDKAQIHPTGDTWSDVRLLVAERTI